MPRRRKTTTKAKPRRLPRISLGWLKLPEVPAVRSGARLSVWLGAIGLVVAAWIVGVPRLQAYASLARRADAIQVRFVDPPPWFRGDLASMLNRTALQNLSGDPLRRRDLVAIRQALLDTGWFDDIEQVRRVREDLVEVEARFVRPFAVIRDTEGDHLVDAMGKLLPKRYAFGENPNFIAIEGAYFPRPQRPGQVWEGADVAAGLTLIRRFNTHPWRGQLKSIDVAGCLKGAAIKLNTDAKSVIVWGGAPGGEEPLELLAEGKIQRLNFLYQNHGRIDGRHPGEVDITSERAVVTR